MEKKSALILSSALLGALTLSGCKKADDNNGEAISTKNEKCYGIARAGKNDCAAEGNNSCAGTQTVDSDPKGWMYTPKGLCEKIVNGSLEPK
ncbi:MAG: DUF2282 domain-containing protein [Alphaproteobacteria bacterium]